VIFINGCFWHGHRCREGRRVPKTNQEYWIPKIATNRARDTRIRRRLRRAGWKILVIWECQLIRPEVVKNRLQKFLSAPG
jgi:DNA mismatch endonuclease (patch repair protein)